MKNYRFKTSKACEIARVDRAQLNEAIANGHYSCAPETTKGSTRIFNMDQTITLFLFGQMVRLGIPAPKAGEHAANLDWEVRHLNGGPGIVSIVMGASGARCVHTFENGRAVPAGVAGPGEIFTTLAFDIGAIRNHVTTLAEWEESNPILGEDD